MRVNRLLPMAALKSMACRLRHLPSGLFPVPTPFPTEAKTFFCRTKSISYCISRVDIPAHPRNGIEKEYVVHVVGEVNGTVLQKMERGVRDQGEYLKVKKASLTKKRSNGGVLKLVLREGKKREVRRLCTSVGLEVRRLIRVRIGALRMGKFNPGFHRELTAEELASLQGESGH